MDETFNAFHRSIKRGDLAVIRNPLTQGVSASLQNKFGWTLLMLAASEGDTAIGELLVSNGADTNRATNTGQAGTALGTTQWSAVIPLLVGFNQVIIRATSHPTLSRQSLRQSESTARINQIEPLPVWLGHLMSAPGEISLVSKPLMNGVFR